MANEPADLSRPEQDAGSPNSIPANPALPKAERNNIENSAPPPDERKQRGQSFYHKLQNWLAAASKTKGEAGAALDSEQAGSGCLPGTTAATVTIGPELLAYLTKLQRRQHELAIDARPPVLLRSALVLRQVSRVAPQGALTAADEKSIELLARIFDFILTEQSIPAEIRMLIGRLQVPLLKVALIDKDFFFKEQHPARRLIETLAKTGMSLDRENGRNDPLYQVSEQIVERVQLEFDQQLELFSEVVAGLDAFIAEETQLLEGALTELIAEALRREKLQQAHELAEKEVGSRVETGEVAGFVEKFLEQQWIPVLASAYGKAESRPEALEHALKTMDDLIWSLKPRFTLEERKDLVAKLPVILSMMDGWLDERGWDDAERAQFFSKLAERHAAIVRAPLELSSRRQVEMAVNVAQKASNRQMRIQAKKMKRKKLDQFVKQVDTIECGACLEFVRANKLRLQFKVAWISPQRSQFIFADRRGGDAFSLTTDELAQAFRDRSATIVPLTSVIDCALATALDEIGLA